MKLITAVLVAGLALIPVSIVSAQTFSIEKTGDIALDLGDEITGQIGDLIQDADGRFYLTDFQQNTVWMCDSKGRLIRRIGREGSGPGELNFPSGTTVYEDKVIVLDKGNSRVVVFKMDGTYVNDFRVNFFMATGILASKDGRIAVNSLWEPTLFTVFDMDGNIVGSKGERVPDQSFFTMMGDQHFNQTSAGHILYSTVKEYPVLRMTWDGTVLAEYEADSPGYGKFEFPSGVQFPHVNDILKTWTPILRPLAIGDHVLVQRKKVDVENGIKYYGDLFTMDGTPVQLAMELPFQFYAVDGDLLYGIDTTPVNEGADNPHIVVFRLRESAGQ
ncbi:MAG: 6-bladed beta-propeller [Gemmatimonadota bacterium]|nr:6-bladed beta-propeller [Gemmatimonadota bacterium]